MQSDQDKRHKRTGWIASISVPLVLLILFYFLVAWKEPFPPIPSYGIELSFGVQSRGTGSQPIAVPEPAEENPEEEMEAAEEPVEETTDETELTEDIPEEDTELAPEETPLTKEPSPDVVKPETTESVKAAEEPVKETKDEKPELNPEATMPAATKDDNTNKNKGTTEEKGNEGREEGTIDGRALMGKQGAADGANLDMTGWIWDSKPNPKDDSSESGKVIYRIKIDDSGYVIGIELVSSTVSPVVERYYRQSIEKITFSQTTNTPAPPNSTGTITFIIRSM